MKIVLPNTYCESVDYSCDPIFFFAGPVDGGGNWQQRCFKELQKHLSVFTAVIPCKYDANHSLTAYKVVGDEDRFSRQTLWERHYLQITAMRTNGCIIFWLACESKDNPRKDGSPYARDTYGELGEWRGRMMNNPNLHVVIGAEVGFPGLSQIRANFNGALKGEFCILTSLQETIMTAMSIITRT